MLAVEFHTEPGWARPKRAARGRLPPGEPRRRPDRGQAGGGARLPMPGPSFVSLRIHSDRSLVPAGGGHVVMLYPFWGKNPEDPADPNSGRFDRYAASGAALIELASLDDAALAVFPTEWSVSLRRRLQGASRKLQVPSVSRRRSSWVGTTTSRFRTSRRSCSRRPSSARAAGRTSSRSLRGASFRDRAPRRAAADPGQGPAAGDRILRPGSGFPRGAAAVPRIPRTPRSGLGPCACSASMMGSRRTSSSGSASSAGRLLGGGSTSRRCGECAANTFANMVKSDYILCGRGAGNFSYRLYETLCCGRIRSSWTRTACFPTTLWPHGASTASGSTRARLQSIGDKVVEFHEGLDEGEFEELQRACRRFWEEYIAPEGFFARFHEHLVTA